MQELKIRNLSVIIFLLLGISTNAQQIDYKPDFSLINKKLSVKPADPYKRTYIYKDEPSVVKKINPVNALFGGALYLYQNIISKHLSSGCLYTPSCSEFGKEAIRKYGIIKGLCLSVDRVHRCDKFTATDLRKYSVDPVTNKYPDPISRYKKVREKNDN